MEIFPLHRRFVRVRSESDSNKTHETATRNAYTTATDQVVQGRDNPSRDTLYSIN